MANHFGARVAISRFQRLKTERTTDGRYRTASSSERDGFNLREVLKR